MLEIKNVYKTYTSNNGVSYRALENISLKFASTGINFILGKSGSGKSTLLNLIGGLDNFDRGEITFNGQKFSSFTKEQFESYRNLCVGFVFQDFCLLDTLTAFENVKLALSLQGKDDNKACIEALRKVGIENLKNRKVNELTGGQKQKIAIARAIVKKAKIILADEPTGSLDSESSNEIMKLLASLAKDSLVIIVTHNKDLADEYGKRVIEIQDGFILKDIAVKKEDSADDNKNIMYSSSLLYLPKGNKLSDAEVAEINTIMQEKRQDYFLLVEQNKERIASLHPNMKEIFFPSRKEDKYVPYNYEEKESENYKIPLKHKTLPLGAGLKLGGSLTRKRKGKVALTIIITFITTLITGFLSNFANYNLEEAIGVSLRNDKATSLNITSSFSVSDENYKIQNRDMKIIDDLGFNYAKAYNIPTAVNFSSKFNGSKDPLFTGTVAGFVETDDLSKIGYDYLYRKDNITAKDLKTGINISSVAASTLVYYKVADNMQDLIGLKTKINNVEYPIIGIFDTDHEKWDQIRNLKSDDAYYQVLMDEYNYVKKDMIQKLVVDPSFMENYIENYGYYNSTMVCQVKSYEGASTLEYANTHDITISTPTQTKGSTTKYVAGFKSGWNEEKLNTDKNYRQQKFSELEINEILVGSTAFKSIFGETYNEANLISIRNKLEKFNSTNHTLTFKAKNDLNEIYYTIENVQIVGVFTSISGSKFPSAVYLSHDLFKEVSKSYFMPSDLKLYLEKSMNYKNLVETLYSNGFVINNQMSDSIILLINDIKQYSLILQIGLVVWIAIVFLLLYSFMSKSIKDSKRQIGILKALGAKGKDIYKAFIYEAMLVALISILGAVVVYSAVSIIANFILSYNVSFYYPEFIVDAKTILIMIVPTLVALVISLMLPISKANKIKPIDVMNRE